MAAALVWADDLFAIRASKTVCANAIRITGAVPTVGTSARQAVLGGVARRSAPSEIAFASRKCSINRRRVIRPRTVLTSPAIASVPPPILLTLTLALVTSTMRALWLAWLALGAALGRAQRERRGGREQLPAEHRRRRRANTRHEGAKKARRPLRRRRRRAGGR